MPGYGMLKSGLQQRVITASWLATVFLVTLLVLPPVYLSVLCAAVLLVAAWEWSAFAGRYQRNYRILYASGQLLFFVLFTAALTGYGDLFAAQSAEASLKPLITVAAGIWLFALVAVLRYPRTPANWLQGNLILVFGTLVLLAAICSLFFLRIQPGGELWILYCVAVVAAADIGAYFSGKKWGKRKLATSVSPGKTWEGVMGGVVAAQCVALLTYWLWVQNLQSLSAVYILPAFLGVALLQSLASVVGDLFESLLKRRAGMKDSGTILPGHGGVLDRIDGLLASLPLFTFCYIGLGW